MSMIGYQVNDEEQMRTKIHTLTRIRTHGLSVQTVKAYASDCGHWDQLATSFCAVHSSLYAQTLVFSPDGEKHTMFGCL
jgi:hypothetical protein